MDDRLRAFVEEALGVLGAPPSDYFLLSHRGRVFAVLPMESDCLLRTLALYRPQNILARVWIGMVRLGHRLGVLNYVLPSWRWGVGGLRLSAVGLFIGNPAHLHPRVLFCRKTSSGWEFGKFCPTSGGRALLEHEASMLRTAEKFPGTAPTLRGLELTERGGVLKTEYLDSCSANPSPSERISLLAKWLYPMPSRPLNEFHIWQILAPLLSAQSISLAESIPLRPCLRHGDFAPWNILRTKSGRLMAVDWESGCAEDAPGFDWVHDLLQHEFLLQKSAFPIAKLRILKKMETGPGAAYLTSCGWSDHIQLLLFLALNLESSLRPEIYDWMGGSLRDSLYSSD